MTDLAQWEKENEAFLIKIGQVASKPETKTTTKKNRTKLKVIEPIVTEPIITEPIITEPKVAENTKLPRCPNGQIRNKITKECEPK